MRELILLRHAHAEPSLPGQADFDRPLSAEGLAEADAVATWLRDKALVPDRVLCSPARRTRETLDAVMEVVGSLDKRLEQLIYEAMPGTLAGLIDGHRDCDRLMLVGHNPGLERLVALLHSGQSGDYRGMPPAAVAVLSLPADAAIEPGIATLSAFWWP
ncbi:SixA phosphatase family protein [Luteimonas kalidii]|uniref:Histidine phosphatase family protein n=1 Tax=Luteimonas kalidii TaxID=3042025 RepID=A0ABT6JRP6_9GAMM|nr:histidine phosphatase family protein [Luteimonas kalidii]MDH5833359.1 histidine phosphatase family protein [Luteimonas kalidii]